MCVTSLESCNSCQVNPGADFQTGSPNLSQNLRLTHEFLFLVVSRTEVNMEPDNTAS